MCVVVMQLAERVDRMEADRKTQQQDKRKRQANSRLEPLTLPPSVLEFEGPSWPHEQPEPTKKPRDFEIIPKKKTGIATGKARQAALSALVTKKEPPKPGMKLNARVGLQSDYVKQRWTLWSSPRLRKQFVMR